MTQKRWMTFLIACMLLLVSFATGCSKQQKTDDTPKYPLKSINTIVGFPAGGPTDTVARGIVPILQEKLGVGVVVNNTPGAAGATAAASVLDQGKDGYTVYFGPEVMSLWQVMNVMDLSPVKDFIPIKLVAEARPVLAVPPGSRFKTVQELIDYAKEHPGELRLSTAGPGTVPHISGLILEQKLGAKFTFVPFQGGQPAITAVMGGQVDATIEMVQSMAENHKGGLLNILAALTNEPISGLDNIPAMGKIYPELSGILPYGPYFGLFVSKDVPAHVVEILSKAMDEAVKDPRWTDYTKQFYLVQIDYSGQQAIDYLNAWTSKSAWILYDAGGAAKSPADFGIPRP